MNNMYRFKQKLAKTTKSYSVLRYLSKDQWVSVRQYVARNPNTHRVIMEDLYKDNSPYVRYWLALNPNTSLDILELLSKDKDDFVRQEAKISIRYNRYYNER